MGTTAKRTINRKPRHKIDLGAPGQIDSTYTVRQFLAYEQVMAGKTADEVVLPSPDNANLDKAMTFAEWGVKV